MNMIGLDENTCAEKSIKRFLDQYELPLKVRKNTWFGPFYFKVERIDATGKAIGRRFRGSNCYDEYTCSIHEMFCLYGENTEKKHLVDATMDSQLLQEKCNPNNLDLDMSHYFKGSTILYVRRDSQVYPVIFDHFEKKNGKTVIYVIRDGKKSFYAFPSSIYLFPNKDDGNVSVEKAALANSDRDVTSNIAAITKIIDAYSKLPKSHRPSIIQNEEITYEKTYHGLVSTKLQNDLIEPRMAIATSQNDLRQASDDYRQACIDARENGGIWDDHAYLSAQIRSDSANRAIKSATLKIHRIESLSKKPYFARVDCGSALDNLHTAYLGEEDIAGYVTSWRNPEIGNAYYHSSILQTRDDIVIALKRMIEIENAHFVSFEDEINRYRSTNDTYKNETAATADDLLIRLLKISREDKSTHDIIKTIQTEQYDIITSSFTQNAVINGCAGSGKTMIMYHRLSYIAYNYESFTHAKFMPESVYLISPSVYFDLSNNSLLDKLSIASVNHAPLTKTAEALIRKYCAAKNLATLYDLSTTEGENSKSADKFFNKGTFDNFISEIEKIQADQDRKNMYEAWVIGCINRLLTEAGLPVLEERAFSNVNEKYLLLYSENYYYNSCFNKRDEPSNTSRDRKKRLIKTIASISAENIQEAVTHPPKRLKSTTLNDRITHLKNYSNSSLWRMALATNPKSDSSGHVVASLDGDGFWELFDKPSNFKKMLTLILVEKILNCVFSSVYSGKDYLLQCVYTGEQLIPAEHRKNRNCLLYYLAALTRKFGAIVKEQSFVFIDEFQNYSPFELRCVKDAFENPAINLYGDFDQRIEEKGEALQSELQSIIAPRYYNININYRNARQITNYINQAVHKNMISIGVDGCVSELKLHECSFQLNNRTAIIAKDSKLARRALDNMGIRFLNDLVVSNALQDERITLASVSDCKGLEFDTVYVLDYGMSENEKYVAYTRALDNLIVIHDDLTIVSSMKGAKTTGQSETPSKHNMDGNECDSSAEKSLNEEESSPTETQHEEKQRADKCCSRSLKTINMVGNSKDFCSNAIEDLLPNKTGYPLEFEIELAKETSGQMEKEPQILGLQEATNAGIITVKKEDVAIKKPANIKKSDADVNGGNYVIDDIMHRDQIPVQQMISLSDSERHHLDEMFKDSVYYEAIEKFNSTDILELQYALHLLESIGEWRDTAAKVLAFQSKIELIKLEKDKSKRKMAEYRSHKVCQHCGGSFRGFFSKRCIKCGRKKDY